VAVTGPPLITGIVANDKWLTRFRTTLVAVLGATVLGIACLAFYTSFEAIRAYAVRSQGIAPEHAWAVPLLVDSFIVVATGADLWFTTTKHRRAWWEVWWPKLLLAGAAAVSFVLNVAHAEPTWAARGVAAIPPAALVLGVELLMMVLRRATTLRATRLQVEAEAAQEASMAAPLQRIQIEAMRRPRRDTTLAAATAPARAAPAEPKAGALPRPGRVTGLPAGGETFRQAVAAAKSDVAAAGGADDGDEARPRRRQAPYMVASAILDERADADTLTPAELVEAMAERGVTVSQATAQALLRELRSPLSTRMASRRPTRAPRATGTGNGGQPTARPR
jgi:DhnA family fructose-bisphosphate aldolase class Ia